MAALLSWRPYPWQAARAGLDSWQAGLAIGFEHHLQWGPQLIFTFGPYGFVEDIVAFYRLTAGLAVLYTWAVTWGVAALVTSALRPSWRLLPAGAVAWASLAVAGSLLEAPQLALAASLGLALASLRLAGGAKRLVALGALGAIAGFQLLVEVNVGLVSTGLAVLAAAAAPRPARRAGALAGVGGLAATVVLAWAAAGQSLSNLASYFRGALSVAAGYSAAMGLSTGRRAEDLYAVVAGVLAAVLLAWSARGRPGRDKAALCLMAAGLGWATVKEGFVRHDKHDLVFFGLALVVTGLARLPRRLVGLQAAALVVAAVVACAAAGGVPGPLRSPGQAANAAVQEVLDLASPGRWGQVASRTRHQLLASGDTLPPGLLAELGNRTMAALPWEDGLSYAYPQLRWAPEPVLQGYSAYTAYLDHLDASFLASARAPERALYQVATIDGRDPWYDPPGAMVALYCHYAQLAVSGPWQVLARVPDRCGPARAIARLSAHFGQVIRLPSVPGELVTASFSLSSPLLARLQGLALRPPAVYLWAWAGQGRRPTRYRFVPGTAADAHVVAVPPALGYSPPFAPPTLQAVELSGGGWARGQGTVRVTLYARSLRR